ncbi:MAG: glutamine-hydrolyzing carbamoyl-phosphate synthase small subunit [Planctomycetota bacterium]
MSESHGPEGSDRPASLVLEDGSEFSGRAFGAIHSCGGEVVFATGMVGYPESLTDPSYRGQILLLTYPLVGNYGVPARHHVEAGELPAGFESDRIQATALVISKLSLEYSHWKATRSLASWLAEEGVVGLSGIDTRAVTKKLRDEGSMAGKILVEGDTQVTARSPFEDIHQRNLVKEVSVREPVLYGNGRTRVILVDCGAKANIIRSLVARGASVLRVPWDHDFNAEDASGVMVSNGPGNPKLATATVENLRVALSQDRPLFGICLGNQLVGLAAGCDTYKLKFGHRSQNQPCQEVGTQRCFITSQNHGFAINGQTLPQEWQEWFVNTNDGTNEGIRHRQKPFRTVQFHPEATPGPTDTSYLFDEFLELLR